MKMEYEFEYYRKLMQVRSDTIFVFGSNLQGIHGAGAAYTAYKDYGARMFHAEGIMGRSYALPTVNTVYQPKMDLQDVKKHVDIFKKCADLNSHLVFLVTQIGCGLAGHKVSEVAPMFAECASNCILPEAFVAHNNPSYSQEALLEWWRLLINKPDVKFGKNV